MGFTSCRHTSVIHSVICYTSCSCIYCTTHRPNQYVIVEFMTNGHTWAQGHTCQISPLKLWFRTPGQKGSGPFFKTLLLLDPNLAPSLKVLREPHSCAWGMQIAYVYELIKSLKVIANTESHIFLTKIYLFLIQFILVLIVNAINKNRQRKDKHIYFFIANIIIFAWFIH